MLLLISCSIRPQGWALVASGRPRQLTFGPGQLKKVFWSPSCALSPLCSIRLWGKSGNWLLHFYLVDKIRKKKEKYSFAQYVVKLFTFEDLKVTVMFHSTWFHMNPNYNNYWNNSSFHLTRFKLHRYCKNKGWTLGFSFRWSVSDLFQCFYGFGKCSMVIFISNKDSFYMQISSKPALFVGVYWYLW